MVKYYHLIHGKEGRDDRLHVPTHAEKFELYTCTVMADGTLIYRPKVFQQ